MSLDQARLCCLLWYSFWQRCQTSSLLHFWTVRGSRFRLGSPWVHNFRGLVRIFFFLQFRLWSVPLSEKSMELLSCYAVISNWKLRDIGEMVNTEFIYCYFRFVTPRTGNSLSLAQHYSVWNHLKSKITFEVRGPPLEAKFATLPAKASQKSVMARSWYVFLHCNFLWRYVNLLICFSWNAERKSFALRHSVCQIELRMNVIRNRGWIFVS